jgi:hypothetical protein
LRADFFAAALLATTRFFAGLRGAALRAVFRAGLRAAFLRDAALRFVFFFATVLPPRRIAGSSDSGSAGNSSQAGRFVKMRLRAL